MVKKKVNSKPKEKPVLGYISVLDNDRVMQEEFQGVVFDKPRTFPKSLGADHPFDFEDAEKVYKKVGFVAGTVNKWTNSLAGDFSINVENPNAQAILDSFLEDTNFTTVLDSWIREGVLKGNGFMELDLDNGKVRVMNANNMYVKRNKKGKVLKYNQFTGDLNRFSKDSKLLIEFKPNQIAHLPFNKIPNDPYGIGIVWPNERVIENIIQLEQDLQKLSKRKAGAPMHIKMGVPGEHTSTNAIDQAKSDMTFLNNRTEWATDANVDIKVIDFPNLSKNLLDPINHQFRMFLAGTGMMEVLMGSGQLNEGIAKVQQESFDRDVKAKRNKIEDVLEEKVFRPLLRANGFDETITFTWVLPGEERIDKRLAQIKELLSSNTILSAISRGALELELASLMGLEDLTDILPSLKDIQKAEEERNKEREEAERKAEEEEIEQPEVPGAKPNANETTVEIITEKPKSEMTIQEFVNLKELAGFNYTDYLAKILQIVNKDKFVNLAAVTEIDFEAGLLGKEDIDKLRIILKDGFKDNKTIVQIEKEVADNIDLKDRIKDGKVVALASRRPNSITRTETVRLANEGLVSLYKENKIEKVRWLAALSDRTCPLCEGLNGQVFNITELNVGINQPPLHTSCRCSLISILE